MEEGTKFLDAVAASAKMMYKQALATCQAHPREAAWLLDPLARWSETAFGKEIFSRAAQGYARYCLTVAKAQRNYEATGIYNSDKFAAIQEHVYQDPSYMIPYMWAAVLIYPFWPSMVNHIRLFRENFVEALPARPKVLELGCGHGVLGLLVAEHRADATVRGIDLSPSAIEIAEKLRVASGLGGRVEVAVEDASELSPNGAIQYDGIIFAMLAEHLEQPSQLFAAVKRKLAPRGVVFFSTAIESPQPDHVYELHSEAEAMQLAEQVGLRARSMVSEGSRIATDAKYRPRAVAMILEHL